MSSNISSSETLKLMGVFTAITNSNNLFPRVKWNEVKYRITEHPQEAFISPMPCPPLQFALVNDSSPVPVHVVDAFLSTNPTTLQEIWYKISVIAVCQNKTVKGDVLKLLLEKGPKETLKPSLRNKMFPFAIKSENLEVLQVLIDFFPWVLSSKSEPNDEIPLHQCVHSSPELLDILLEAGIRHGVGGNESVGGLFLKNSFGESLFDNLVSSINMHDPFDNQSQILKWRRLEVCIKYANFSRIGSTLPIKSMKPSYSCVGFLPSHLFDEALVTIDFEYKSSDIFNLIEMTTTDSGWKSKFGLHDKDLARLIFTLLCIAQEHGHVQKYQYLHFGAEHGLKWSSGLKEILCCDSGSLSKIDQKTNLVPFLAAASGLSNDLDAIYELLRRDPSQASKPVVNEDINH